MNRTTAWWEPLLTAAPLSPGIGESSLLTASGPPPDGFYAPADLRPRPLAPSRIFGAVRRFKVELDSPDAVSREDSPIPGLSGAAVNTGSHQAVVRFIRVTP